MFSEKNQKIMSLEIKIQQGIGDITFDMPVEQVVALLGQPDEVECIDNMADEPTTYCAMPTP